MIDFSEVEEMHGGDNGTERNEVSMYSAIPNLGCLNTAAQLPIMRLGGESEPTRQHYWSQMGEQNQYNATGVNDEEAYLDNGFSRSDWNLKITVGQIFSSKKALLTELRFTALRGHFEFKVQFSCTKRTRDRSRSIRLDVPIKPRPFSPSEITISGRELDWFEPGLSRRRAAASAAQTR
ncbi:hypothetical protein L3X38_010751 [Prunus dulcis]|uniref:Uncharacterized protein n=1 Tax=Prunus dulcis TaxID=3755 RepID=A0AAD4WG29_PRUDU|nr:hypothetical protein L3X38_010751 [Prunus dulcis]